MSAARGVALWLAFFLGPAGCGAPAVPPEPVQADEPVSLAAKGEPVSFDFERLDEKRITSADVAGRLTLVAFIATYDTSCLAEVRIVAAVLEHHKPRINAFAVVLEPEQNLPVVKEFAFALGLPFVLAMADEATLAGAGPFIGLHHVPAIVLLDKDGRERWRYLGLATAPLLERILAAAEKR